MKETFETYVVVVGSLIFLAILVYLFYAFSKMLT